VATEVMEVTGAATEAIEATEVMEVMGDAVVTEVMEVTVEATEAMVDTDMAKDLQMPSLSPRPAQLLYRKLTLWPNRKLILRPSQTSMVASSTSHLTMAESIFWARGQLNLMVATEVMEVTVVATEDIEAMVDMEVMVATVEVTEVMEVIVEATEAMVDTDTAKDLQMLSLRPAQLLYRKLTLRPNRKLMLRPHSITMHTLHLTMAKSII